MEETKVLYLSYDGMTDPLGQSQVIPYLVGLSKRGCRFVLVSFEKKNNFQIRRENIERELAKYSIQWVPLVYHRSPPILSTLFDLYTLKRKVTKLHKEHKFKIVHCRSYITSLIGLSLKRRFGIKFVFDMRGFWADERVEGGLWSLNNILFRKVYQYFKRKEVELLSEADYTICLTEAARKEIHSWQTIANNPIPIQVIPCCVDLQLFNPATVKQSQLKELRESLHISSDKFVLLYVGSIGTWYMVEEMLEFFKVLVFRKPNAIFLIVTKDDPKAIRNIAEKKLIVQERIVITTAERQMMPVHILLANIAIFFIRPVFSKKASSPTKQGEIMGMGVPIICNNYIGDTAHIIQNSRAGLVVDNFDHRLYKSILERLDEIAKLNADEIREGAKKYYSLERGISEYETTYTKVLS